MREDCYAEYACGHIEFDDTLMDVGETSHCNTCNHLMEIMARRKRDTDETGQQRIANIVALIRKHKAECEEAQEKYDTLPGTHHIPLQTVQRKQYAIDAQITLLQTILDEIELQGEYWIVDHPLLHE